MEHYIRIISVVLFELLYLCGSHVLGEIHRYTAEEQSWNLFVAYKDCEQKKNSTHDKFPGEVSCPVDFDSAMCWNQARANTTAVQQCPSHVNKFDSSENAYRFCQPNGQWIADNSTGLPIVNFTMCRRAADEMGEVDVLAGSAEEPFLLLKAHFSNLQKIYTTGYCVSVIFLIIALIIMIALKRLHCPRNVIHMNTFVSFVLRGGIVLLWEYLVLRRSTDDKISDEIMSSTGNWPCRLLATLWMYTRLSNYMWIFVEGLYLHTLIFLTTFSDKSSIKWFILCGWVSPLIVLIPWILVKVYKDNVECWVIYRNRNYRWIIEAPIVLLIGINAVFFGIIIRLLFTKLRASESSSREARIYRKLAKSTLVLIPLFGVHYAIFLFGEILNGSQVVNETVEVVRFYFDSFFTSFQGLMVAVLFCFLNGEVRGEIIKKWNRWTLNRKLPSQSVNHTHNTTLNSQARTSISSADSLPTYRNPSRHPSINSIKSSSPPAIPEESQYLLTPVDGNQNELRIITYKNPRVERTT